MLELPTDEPDDFMATLTKNKFKKRQESIFPMSFSPVGLVRNLSKLLRFEGLI